MPTSDPEIHPVNPGKSFSRSQTHPTKTTPRGVNPPTCLPKTHPTSIQKLRKEFRPTSAMLDCHMPHHAGDQAAQTTPDARVPGLMHLWPYQGLIALEWGWWQVLFTFTIAGWQMRENNADCVHISMCLCATGMYLGSLTAETCKQTSHRPAPSVSVSSSKKQQQISYRLGVGLSHNIAGGGTDTHF